MPYAAALSTIPDAAVAAEQVCRNALAQLGDAVPDLALVFYSPHHVDDGASLARSVYGRLGGCPVLGVLGESVIGTSKEIEDKPAVSLWCASWGSSVGVHPFHLTLGETPDGPSLFGWPDALFEENLSNAILLAFGDPYTFPVSELFLPTLNEDYPGLKVVGGMSSLPGRAGPSTLFWNDEPRETGAIGVLLTGGIKVRTVVSQGCRPVGRPMVVTKCRENIILELGGEAPLSYLQNLLNALTEADRRLAQSGLLIGVAVSEYRETFERGDFVIRNLMGIDPKSGAIAVTDRVRVGQTIQFQLRDANAATDDLTQLLQQDLATNPLPKSTLLFSCNGRGSRMFITPDHDVQTIQKQTGILPLAGFFAAGELGPIGGRNFIHGFTASIALFE